MMHSAHGDTVSRHDLPWRGAAQSGAQLPSAVAGKAEGGHRAAEEVRQRVGIGEVAASATPVVLQAVLGSCVAVCLYDPALKIGGMNHILVPSSRAGRDCAARCGVQAMELLINAMMHLGADRRRFVAKAFGGANVLPNFTPPTVGELNAGFVRRFLATEKIPLLAERMGGNSAVQLRFDTASSKATVRAVSGAILPAIVREEDRYFHAGLCERFHVEEPIVFERPGRKG